MPQNTLSLLGSFAFTYQDKPVSLGRPRLEELCAYLALHTPVPVSRREIAFRFWPDSTEKQALTNLRKALHLLRRHLPDADRFIHRERHSLQWLDHAPCSVDTTLFDHALAQADGTDEAETVVKHLSTAVSLYRGDLLTDSYSEWVIPYRERLHQRYAGALNRLMDLLTAQGRYADAAGYAEQAVAHDPLHEAAYLRLMELYSRQGDRSRALRVYHACVPTLRREMGVEPNQEIQNLYQQLLAVDHADAPVPPPVNDMGPVASQLIGRQAEWHSLRAAWDRLQQQPVQMALITGEAGIGKTRLAEELFNWADRQGVITARAQSYAAEGELAYAPLCDWLRTPRLRALHQTLGAVWLTELARLLPELLDERSDLAAPAPFTEQWQRQRLYTALAYALLEGNRPILLLLDDLQWADAETLHWLHYCLRFARSEGAALFPKARLFLLCTLRDTEIGVQHPLRQWLRQLGESTAVHELPLAPLSPDESVRLAEMVTARPLTSQELKQLEADTGGNPLFVIESARAGPQTAPLESDEAMSDDVRLPPPVLKVMRTRLARLSAPARKLVGVAAVIGRAFRYELLIAVGNQTEDDVVQALEELWQRKIFQESGSDAYDFSHGRLRDVAYAQLSRPRRRLLHRRVADALQRAGFADAEYPAAQVAGHYERAGLADRAVAQYLLAGEQALEAWSAEQAAIFFARAHDLASNEEELARVLFGLARTRFHRGQRAAALTDVAEALTLLNHVDHELRGQLLYLRADLYAADAEPDAAERAARAALDAAQRSGDQTTVCQSLSLLGMMHSHRGELELEFELIAQALDIARASGNRWREARTQVDLAFLHAQMGEFSAAMSLAQTALTHLETTTDLSGVAFAWNILGRAYGGIGHFGRAFHAFEQCRQVADEIELNSIALQIPNMRGWLYRQLGDPARALELDREGAEAAAAAQIMTAEISARLNLCHDRLLLDGPDAALAGLQTIEKRMKDGDFGYHGWRWRLRLRQLQGLCALQRQDSSKVLTHAAEGAALARRTSAKKYIALFDELTGAALALQGDYQAAVDALERALEMADDIECRPVALQCRVRLACLLRAAGDTPQADIRLGQARALADAIAADVEDCQLQQSFLAQYERFFL